VPVEYGVLVLQVASGGFADRVGIKAGDVITASGDHNIVRAEALQQVVEAAATSVMLHVQRGAVGRDVDVSLELPPTPKAQDAARPEDAAVMRDQVQALQREIDKLRAQLKSQAKD
jgi:S1-C subfamily serine protease